MKISLKQIKPSPFQVRARLNGELLGDLKVSMKEVGLIVPIKVRPKDGIYELVYGHRRFEAAKLLKWDEIEAIVEDLTDKQVKLQALVENIQRDDLDPLDEAQAYFNLWSKGSGDMTLKEIGNEVGRSHGYISQFLNLMDMSDDVKQLLASGISHRHGMPEGKISPDHVAQVTGRVEKLLVPIILKKAADEGLSVSKTMKVANSVKAANTDKFKQGLIDAQYSEFVHDPERVKEVVEKRGGIDPFTTKELPKQKLWDEAVAHFLQYIKQMRWWVEDFEKAVDAGQLSPEAKPFVATRLKTLRNDINRILEKLEE